MNRADIKKVLDELTGDINSIVDKKAVSIIKVLINLIEMLVEENAQLVKTCQALKDEVNRLKGEQGKPDIKAGKDDTTNQDHSSEKERNGRGAKKERKPKNKKTQTVRIDKRVTVEIDRAILPADAQFKGFDYRIVQDLIVITNNIEFKLPMYYSASLKKTFIAPMPTEYDKGSEFGPGLKSLIITMYRDSGMTIPAIGRFLKTFDTQISQSTISRILTEEHDDFHKEKEDIFNAGMKAGLYQQIDDTGCRVNGQNYHMHVFCGPLFTAYFTRKHKDRLTLLDIICCGDLRYALNQDAYDLMMSTGLSAKWLDQIKPMLQTELLTRDEINAILLKLLPNPKKHRTTRRIILESAALVYYRHSNYFIQHLMSDDASQFNKLALHHSLCWIHEGRHYKKLNPISALNRKILDAFLEQFWDYYNSLLLYTETPSAIKAKQLSEDFDNLFKAETGYDALDTRITMTRAKQDELLLVLAYPFLPLHNNSSELGARVQARMRDINLQTISKNGTKSKDTFATIVQTAKKLGVNVYQYIYDRLSKKYEMPSLAALIMAASATTTIDTT